MTAKFYPSERKLIKSILVKNFGKKSEFLNQFRMLRCASRQMTGTGYYLNFLVNERVAPVDDINTELSDGLPTRLLPPQDMVGFTLFIRNGRISWLEGYTFGDVGWPEQPMEDWLKLDRLEQMPSGAN
jgi:hypothetical protein